MKRLTGSVLAGLVGLVLVAIAGCTDPGVGAGEGEGEGDAGEGEGDAAGEGEGDAGEGEGDAGEGEGEGDASVTWFRDVLPIARDNCEVCHTAGGIGPFDIEDTNAVTLEQDLMVDYVFTRVMPPWMPARNCGTHTYQGDRSLTDAEIAVFTAWRDGGFALGDAADTSGTVPALAGLDRVDLEIAPATAYTPVGGIGDDDYHCFLLDPSLSAQKFVTATNILPGQASMVHHVLLYAVDRQAALDRDAQDPNVAGWTCFGGPDAGDSSQQQVLATWAPGSSAQVYPAGTGIALAASQVIVMQVHYNFDAAPTPTPSDITTAQLKLEDTVPTTALLVPLVDSSFSLGQGVSSTSKSFPGLRRKVWGLLPHMHQLGTHISVVSGAHGCLIDIPQWDFHWQQAYFFDDVDNVQMGDLEQVTLSCTWDNETGNTVTFGENTTDEMCLAFAYITP